MVRRCLALAALCALLSICYHLQVQGTWLAPISQEEEKGGKGYFAQGLDFWCWEKIQEKGAFCITSTANTSFLEHCGDCTPTEIKGSDDVVLHTMPRPEQPKFGKMPHMWSALDRNMEESQAIPQCQEQSQTSSQAATEAADSTTAAVTSREHGASVGSPRLDDETRESPLGAIYTSKSTTSAQARQLDDRYGASNASCFRVAATSTTNLAGTTCSNSSWCTDRGHHGGRAEGPRAPQGTYCSWFGAVRQLEDAKRKVGSQEQRKPADGFESWPYQQIQKDQSPGRERQEQNQKDGCRMDEIHHNHDQANSIPLWNVPEGEIGADGAVQQEIGRTQKASGGGECSLEVLAGTEGGRLGRGGRHPVQQGVGASIAKHGCTAEPSPYNSHRRRRGNDPRCSPGGTASWGRPREGGDEFFQARSAHHISSQHFAIQSSHHTLEGEVSSQGWQQGTMKGYNVEKGCSSAVCSSNGSMESKHDNRPCGLYSQNVRFCDEVQIVAWDLNGEEVSRIVPSDLCHAWCRSCWHLDGQVTDWGTIKQIFTAPLFHIPSMFSGESQESHLGHKNSESSGKDRTSNEQFSCNAELLHKRMNDELTQVVDGVLIQDRQPWSEVWFLRKNYFHVCLQARRVQLRGVKNEQDLQIQCEEVWYELLGDEPTELYRVTPQPKTYPNVHEHLILVQGDMSEHVAVLMKSHAWPILRSQRAALIPRGADVSQVFHEFQFSQACLRQGSRCAIKSDLWDDQQMFQDGEIPRFVHGQLVEGFIMAIVDSDTSTEGESSDEDISIADESTKAGSTDAEDSDSVSLVSQVPVMHLRSMSHHAYPWEHIAENHLIEATDEETESHHEFAPAIHEIQHALQNVLAQGGDQDMTVVTFGIGLVALGRRDLEISRDDAMHVEDLVVRVVRLWEDHAQHGFPIVHLVCEQPVMQEFALDHPYLVLLITIDYQEVTWRQPAVLIQQHCPDDTRRTKQLQAVRIERRLTSVGLLTTLRSEEGVYPYGVREHFVTCRGRRMRQGEAHEFLDGDFCDISIGAFPIHVSQTASFLSNYESFFRDWRSILEDHGNDQVVCRFHGSSPSNIPLGHRDLRLDPIRLFRADWAEQAAALWPFQEQQGNYRLTYVEAEDPVEVNNGGNEPIFHFVLSYAVDPERIPVLITQTMMSERGAEQHYEQWAYDASTYSNLGDLYSVLDPRFFWTGQDLNPVFSRSGRGSEWQIGEVISITVVIRSREDLLARMVQVAQRRNRREQPEEVVPVEQTSLLQMPRRKAHSGFEEICMDLVRQQKEEARVFQTYAETHHRHDDSTHRHGVPKSEGEILNTLQEILEELRTPWKGLNHDFQAIPHSHPMVDFAIQNTEQSMNIASRFHIFTDGSFQKCKLKQNGEERKASAAWAFVVLCEDWSSGYVQFKRIGYAAQNIEEMKWLNQLSAPVAEAFAIIAMSEYILSLPAHVALELHVHFDAVGVGMGAFSCQKEIGAGKGGDPIQHHARNMITLVKQRCSQTQPIHVKAHDGAPFNEMADSLAVAARKGWKPPIAPELRSWNLMKHPLQDWAWIQFTQHAEIPRIEGILSNHCQITGKGWQDRVLQPLGHEGKEEAWKIDLQIATVNVGTMNYDEEHYQGTSVKARELARQFSDAHLDLVGLQETRARETKMLYGGPFVRLIAAGQNGQAGVELWINREALRRKTGHDINPDADVCVWFSSPRILGVTIECSALQLDVMVCYAPQRGRTWSDIEAWWKELDVVLSKKPHGRSMIWLGDWNCSVGSVESEGISGHQADVEDDAGEKFRQACSRHDMVLPSTSSQYHQGPAWTYVSPLGFKSRIDFVAVHSSIVPGVTASFVDDSIDVMNGDHDHKVLVLRLCLQQSCSQDGCAKRHALYDRDKARENKKRQKVDLMQMLPVCPWEADVNHHWCSMRDHIQDLSAKLFPKQKRQKRQEYFSAECWSLLCHRKELRQMHREQQRNAQQSLLHSIFRLWKTKQQATHKDRADNHMHRQSLALTLHMRQQVDHNFRKQKKKEWKDWVAQQANQLVDQMKHAKGSDLFRILKPKQMVAKNKGQMVKHIPGMKDGSGQWQVGQKHIVLAWQQQFSAVENATETRMQEMMDKSIPSTEALTLEELMQVPSIHELEDALRAMKDSKASGLDALGAELFQVDVTSAAQRIYPILLKAATRAQTVPDFSGGWLIPLFKGRGSAQSMPGYRGIMLEAVVARVIARCWRPRLEQGLKAVAAPMQWGGRRGLSTESLHLQTRLWISNAKASKLAVSIIYVDIRAAFYSVAKQLLTGCFDHAEIDHVAELLAIPETAREALAANICNTQAVLKSTGSKTVAGVVSAMLQDTWFVIPSGRTVLKPATGSRPGDPVADILFGMIMGHMLQTIGERLDNLGIWECAPKTNFPLPMNLTWVDDTAFAIYAQPEQLIPKTLTALSVIVDTAIEYGMELSYGIAKTTVVSSFFGRGAVEARQKHEKAFPHELPVVTEHAGVVSIPTTNGYKHLGGYVSRNGSLMAEINIRAATALTRAHALKKVLKNEQIDLKARQTVLHTMCMSVVSVHAGTWFNMKAGEFQKWQATLHKLYALLHNGHKDHDAFHVDSYHLARQADGLMPMEALHVAKLRLFAHIVQVGDELMIGAILSNFECAGNDSWLMSLRRSLEWMQEQIGDVNMLDEFDQLQKTETWEQLRSQAPRIKKLVKQAQVSHKSRIRTLCTLKQHADFQKRMIEDMGFQCQQTEVEQVQDKLECETCGFQAADHAALAVHHAKRHGQRLALRRYAEGAACHICRRMYHTRPRLLQHLHNGSTDCWVLTMRRFSPMTEQQAMFLDERDKEDKVAHHQRGIKARHLDRQWRMATEQELTLTNMQPKEAPDLDEHPPTEGELQEWIALGTLPTGRGGRPKTQRAQSDGHIKHVHVDTANLERDLLQRAQTWTCKDCPVPRPIAEGKKFALLLFAGHRRIGDMACWLDWDASIQPVPIDLAIHEVHGDVAQGGLWERLIRTGRVVSGHAGPPCETYTLARWLPNEGKVFPRPLRDALEPWGMRNRTVPEVHQCEVGTYLMVQALRLLLLIYCFGGSFSLEHPRGPETAEVQWSIWHSAFVKELLNLPMVEIISFLQGPLGRPYPKPTRLLVARMPFLRRRILEAYRPGWKATEFLGGKSGNQWRTAAAKVYPTELSRVLSHAFIEYASQLQFSGGEEIPNEVTDAIQALTAWDPYIASQTSRMQADYNPKKVQR